jgi:hypothetical protein
MNDQLKGKLDELFDEGRLGELDSTMTQALQADTEAAAYLGKLRGIDTALVEAQRVEIPAMFKANLVARLPRRGRVLQKATIWQDLVMPIYIAAVLVVSFVFRDFLGITALFEMAANALSSTGGGSRGMDVAFMIISSVGILVAAWAIVAGFFGIRSRRITR